MHSNTIDQQRQIVTGPQPAIKVDTIHIPDGSVVTGHQTVTTRKSFIDELANHSLSTDPIKYKAIMLTPLLAKTWQKNRMRPNRKYRAAKVDSFARDMMANRWKLTHQPIAFDKDGMLGDGQHRVLACIQADVPIQVYIAYYDGMEFDITTIDTGTVRDPADQINLAYGEELGCHVSKMMIAVVRAMLTVSKNGNLYKNLTIEEIHNAIKRHKEALTFVLDKAFEGDKGRARVNASVLAAATRAYYHCDHDRLLDFGRSIMYGQCKDAAKDSAALRLRFHLETKSKGSGSVVRMDDYSKTENAIYHFMRGDHIRYLKGVSEELFEIEEDRL